MNGHHTVTLTHREWASLCEAVRYAQEAHLEGVDRLDPTLSRVQRKLGDEVGAG